MKAYAGIGSRNTPEDIKLIMMKLGFIYASKGYVLRSGGANGADAAFEHGALQWADFHNVQRKYLAEIFLPWPSFNQRLANEAEYIHYAPCIDTPHKRAMANHFVNTHHPAPHALGRNRALMERNSCQVLGRDLNSPSMFIVCWTADGSDTGGTGFAIRMAKEVNVNVFNLHNNQHRLAAEAFINEHQHVLNGERFKTQIMDLRTVTNGLIVQGVNCQNAMGSGLARDLYEKWPLIKTAYHSIGKQYMYLGRVQEVQVEHKVTVLNCWTQEHYGSDNKRYASPEAIAACLKIAFQKAASLNQTLYLPRIGCGLAGLDWNNDVLPILNSLCELDPFVQVVVCDKN